MITVYHNANCIIIWRDFALPSGRNSLYCDKMSQKAAATVGINTCFIKTLPIYKINDKILLIFLRSQRMIARPCPIYIIVWAGDVDIFPIADVDRENK